MENKPNRIIWHHSADTSSGSQFDKINTYHKKKWNYKSILGFYGGYHILIEKDGQIKRYRADNEIGAHDAGENINSLGVCLAGNFNIEHPTDLQIASLKDVLLDWIKRYGISVDRIDPHRMGDTTDCPGKLLQDNFARDLVKEKDKEDLLDWTIEQLGQILAKLRAAH